MTQVLRKAKIELVSDTEVQIQRVFDAPARLVWEATTKPEHLREWYGCSTMKMVECEMDVRPGGKFRWTLRMADGASFQFRGEYREVQPPHRLVATEQFLLGDQWTDELVQIARYDETDGRTTLTLSLQYKTKADRDGHLGAGMEGGMNESHARLDALLAQMPR